MQYSSLTESKGNTKGMGYKDRHRDVIANNMVTRMDGITVVMVIGVELK